MACQVGRHRRRAPGGIDTCRTLVEAEVVGGIGKHGILCRKTGAFILIRKVDVACAAIATLDGAVVGHEHTRHLVTAATTTATGVAPHDGVLQPTVGVVVVAASSHRMVILAVVGHHVAVVQHTAVAQRHHVAVCRIAGYQAVLSTCVDKFHDGRVVAGIVHYRAVEQRCRLVGAICVALDPHQRVRRGVARDGAITQLSIVAQACHPVGATREGESIHPCHRAVGKGIIMIHY